MDRLFHIYNAMYKRNLLYKPWKQFMTVVLQKPGKLHYDILKAHRPIALLNTMWKVLMALIAGQLLWHDPINPTEPQICPLLWRRTISTMGIHLWSTEQSI